MTTEPDFASVGMLIPARIHQAREQVMALLRAELSTDIATSPPIVTRPTLATIPTSSCCEPRR